MYNILILSIATFKYVNFLDNLYEGIERNFLPKHNISFLLFTDNLKIKSKKNLKLSYIEHKPFPEPTLKRYNYFLQEKEYIKNFDYVFYTDVDMSFISPIEDEEIFGNICLTRHVRTYETQNPNLYTYERNPKSTAYIPFNHGISYYAGGFNGGKPNNFLEMSDIISKNVLEDESNGITAIWHDESHLNRYAFDHPPNVILPIQYCCPEPWINKVKNPKIIALNKNHQEVRYGN